MRNIMDVDRIRELEDALLPFAAMAVKEGVGRCYRPPRAESVIVPIEWIVAARRAYGEKICGVVEAASAAVSEIGALDGAKNSDESVKK